MRSSENFNERENLVFILWGNYAKPKRAYRPTKNSSLNRAPVAFSVTKFFGSKPFSKTNEYLEAHGKKPIDCCNLKTSSIHLKSAVSFD